MKNLSELLSIYANAYKHYSTSNNETKIVSNEYGELAILADLANMIATDPYSDITQKNISDHEHHITMYHDHIISFFNKEDDDEDEKNKERIYICKCMKECIYTRILELEKKWKNMKMKKINNIKNYINNIKSWRDLNMNKKK